MSVVGRCSGYRILSMLKGRQIEDEADDVDFVNRETVKIRYQQSQDEGSGKV